MNTTKNRLIQKLLLNKKGKKQNGFTLIELMVVIAIVGVLSAVGLPQLLKAQDRAKISAAQQEVVNYGKECSISLLTGAAVPDATRYDTITVDGVINVCAENATLRADSGVTTEVDDGINGTTNVAVTFTIEMDGAIPGKPESSENA
jgi:prepilin-type N-terminal cleavage/methylation domain-containing protein